MIDLYTVFCFSWSKYLWNKIFRLSLSDKTRIFCLRGKIMGPVYFGKLSSGQVRLWACRQVMSIIWGHVYLCNLSNYGQPKHPEQSLTSWAKYYMYRGGINTMFELLIISLIRLIIYDKVFIKIWIWYDLWICL